MSHNRNEEEDDLHELAELTRLARDVRGALGPRRLELSERERTRRIEAAVLRRLGLPALSTALCDEAARHRALDVELEAFCGTRPQPRQLRGHIRRRRGRS